MQPEMLAEIAAAILMISKPGAVLATVVYVLATILGSKTAKDDATGVKDMFN